MSFCIFLIFRPHKTDVKKTVSIYREFEKFSEIGPDVETHFLMGKWSALHSCC